MQFLARTFPYLAYLPQRKNPSEAGGSAGPLAALLDEVERRPEDAGP